MEGFGFRYSWIAPEILRSYFPSSPFITNLKQLAIERQTLLKKADWQSEDCYSLQRIRAWAKNPVWVDRISHKIIKHAAVHAAEKHQSWVCWAQRVWYSFQESEPPQSPPYDEMREFLRLLCQSDFPQLLLWSKSRFARRIFLRSENCRVALNGSYLNKKRKLAQTTHSCLRFALGGIGRLAPRQAWVGVGFGRFATDGPACYHIGKNKEVILIEPDLAWINRHWRDLSPRRLLPGETAWVYLENRINAEHNVQIRDRYHKHLLEIRRACRQLGENIWDYGAIDDFLTTMDAYMGATVDEQVRRENPHTWWLTRMLVEEISVSSRYQHALAETYREYQAKLAQQGLINDDDNPPRYRPAIPFPLHVYLRQRQQVIATAEEFTHWLLHHERRTPKPWLPQHMNKQLAYVYWLDSQGVSFQSVEPNPRRCMERFAAMRPQPPLYIKEKPLAPGLAPPPALVDNRLIRLAGNEVEREQCRHGDEVMFYNTLLTEETQELMDLELQSTAYRNAPDLIPMMITTTGDNQPTFGHLDSEQRIWYIRPEQIPVFLGHIHNAKQAALWYYWEIHHGLGAPEWLTLVVDGKTTELPIHSLLAFDHLLHLLRTVKTPLIVTCPERLKNDGIIRDGEGKSLATQLLANI